MKHEHNSPARQAGQLQIVYDQFEQAISASKCHQCGCLIDTVDALSNTDAGKVELSTLLQRARDVFNQRKYDCLGCEICFPANAANAFTEIYPDTAAEIDHCPTDTPQEQAGWPPLAGDYTVTRYTAPVAVCALNSDAIVQTLAQRNPEGLAIIGTLHTENLGIERISKNILSNPNIRFLILCGEDTQKAIGHLPGQSFHSLFQHGMDERGRIIQAKGKRPLLKNSSQEEIQALLKQVELVPLIGETNPEVIVDAISSCNSRNPGRFTEPYYPDRITHIQATAASKLTLDKAGYFIIYPQRQSHKIILEHYTNKGFLNCVLEGDSTGALYSEAIERGLVTRLDHAAYLGRELARAEYSYRYNIPFIQDAAPDKPESSDKSCCSTTTCACG